MRTTGHYRDGIERFVPSPSEALLLVTLVWFSIRLYPGSDNTAMLGLSSLVIVIAAWVIGVVLRAATNDMRWWLLLGFLVALIIPVLGQNTFQVRLMAQVCVFALLIYGLNVVTGYTGQISLGHGALVGISAYACAILVTHWSWPVFPAMLVAIAITTIFGFALGVPALRLAGPYLAIATLAAAIVFPLVVKLDTFQDYTGGGQGLQAEQIKPPGPIEDFLSNIAPDDAYSSDSAKARFAHEAYLYYISLAVAVVGVFTVWNLARSRFGRAFIAVRDGEVPATSMGINVALYKVTAFGISAFYAGVSGAMFFLVVAFVAPESFDLLNLSIYPLAYLVIGGLATTGGAVLAAIGYMWVPQVILKVATISSDFDKLQGAMTGLLLIVVMTRLSQGVWGALVQINRLSWEALVAQLDRWARTRNLAFWVTAVAAIIVILAIAEFWGGVWAVFAAGIVLVAPTDAWQAVFGPVARPFVSLWRRFSVSRRDTPAADVPSSLQ
ncbi:MAG: branched-chain amino acid ABC transporter permease [Hyphomicrobiales bacterium]